MKKTRNFSFLFFTFLLLTSQVVYASESFASNYLSSGWISSALLVGGFVFLLISFFIPGTGLPEILSIVSFALFFWGKSAGGDFSTIGMIFSALGILMLVFEIFIPGFSLPGILGMVFLGLGVYSLSGSQEEAILNIFLILLISVVFILYMFTRGFDSKRFEKITLKNAVGVNLDQSFDEEDIDKDKIKVGDVVLTTTILRPYGFVDIDGIMIDVTAESNYIGKDREVVVTEVIGNKIIVKEVSSQ